MNSVEAREVLDGLMLGDICGRCGCAISNVRTGKYCDDCRSVAYKERMTQWMKDHRRTPEYRITHAKFMREYCQTPKGRAANARARAKYYSTPRGKAANARRNAKRIVLHTDPDLYAARVELLHTMCEPCANCHIPYRITHQIDHIVALCLGGTDEWSNLQPLCIRCHGVKTRGDISKLMDRCRRYK